MSRDELPLSQQGTDYDAIEAPVIRVDVYGSHAPGRLGTEQKRCRQHARSTWRGDCPIVLLLRRGETRLHGGRGWPHPGVAQLRHDIHVIFCRFIRSPLCLVLWLELFKQSDVVW